jgi:type IV pilus assembly protein PilW
MTLIEFMVGITIGLLVALAAVGSIIITRSSARSMTDSAALEQQATLVMAQIGQQITQAGAINAYLAGTSPNAGISGTGITANGASAGAKIMFDTRYIGVSQTNPGLSVFGQSGGNAPDNLTITYAQPNDTGGASAQNCNGTAADNTVLPPGPNNAPRVVNIFSVNTATGDLRCGSDKAGAAQPIVGNVVDMRITYLLGGSNVTYQTVAQVAAANTWASVSGIQVCLEMKGDPTQAPQQTLTQDCRGNSNAVRNDGSVHRVFRQTFYLRNSH